MVRAPIKRAVMTENKKFTHDMILGEPACYLCGLVVLVDVVMFVTFGLSGKIGCVFVSKACVSLE